ncbi:MAG: Slp family lipoprotein [Nitrospirota bacterium]|nr:Slp family lipoprotein [Nitrospirota bacterium]
MILFSCAPVLREEIMKIASRDVPISDMRKNPIFYSGKLFILGGLIVNTKLTERGSLIEAVYVPVDSRGYLKDVESLNGRFLAIFPKEKGILDPLIYRKGREITLAGAFIETRTGKIDEMEYTYPVFEIKELYLWEERYYITPAYPLWYHYYPYWWYDSWWGFYPSFHYWHRYPARR